MSVADVVWILSAVAGVAVGLLIRSSPLAAAIGLLMVAASLILFGYSWNYENNDCQPGEPCPTGLSVIRVVNAVFVPFGPTLFIVGLARVALGVLRGSPRSERGRRL
jgi:hypothetical protein